MRCEECGDVRWSLLGLRPKGLATCQLCGGAMVLERRHPDGLHRSGVERRDEIHIPGSRRSERVSRPAV